MNKKNEKIIKKQSSERISPSALFFFALQLRKAGDGNRTHVSSLEGWCSTIELHPHEVPSSGIEPETRGFSVLCSTN